MTREREKGDACRSSFVVDTLWAAKAVGEMLPLSRGVRPAGGYGAGELRFELATSLWLCLGWSLIRR